MRINQHMDMILCFLYSRKNEAGKLTLSINLFTKNFITLDIYPIVIEGKAKIARVPSGKSLFSKD